VWREFYYYLATQALPAGIAALIKCTGDKCVEEGLVAMTVILFIFPAVNALVAYFITGQHRHESLAIKNYILYAIFSMPYELFKFHLSIFGHARSMVGLTKWRVTKRSVTRHIKPDEITGTRNAEITSGLEVDVAHNWNTKGVPESDMDVQIHKLAEHSTPNVVDSSVGDSVGDATNSVSDSIGTSDTESI
jgi:hypothetical protein